MSDQEVPPKGILANIRNKFSDALKTASKETARRAYSAYQSMARKLSSQVPGNTLMEENKERLVTRLYPKHIGRIIMFFYDPKHKETLPYYDRFPLVIPIEFYSDGFLGLNLHYLPQLHRARLMDVLYQTIYSNNKYMDEKKTLQVSYQILKNVSKTKLYKPCIKRYLLGHVRSRFFIVKPDDWQIVIFLPTERFQKKSQVVVYADSLRKAK